MKEPRLPTPARATVLTKGEEGVVDMLGGSWSSGKKEERGRSAERR